jgi:hypothetical protein
MGLSTKGHLDNIRSINGGTETLLGILSSILNGQCAGRRLKSGWKMGISMSSNGKEAG